MFGSGNTIIENRVKARVSMVSSTIFCNILLHLDFIEGIMHKGSQDFSQNKGEAKVCQAILLFSSSQYHTKEGLVLLCCAGQNAIAEVSTCLCRVWFPAQPLLWNLMGNKGFTQLFPLPSLSLFPDKCCSRVFTVCALLLCLLIYMKVSKAR
jgi:hypothetical protein